MTSTADEFLEFLENEAEVDAVRLRDMAQHGVPSELRGVVWKYLLGVAHTDKCRFALPLACVGRNGAIALFVAYAHTHSGRRASR